MSKKMTHEEAGRLGGLEAKKTIAKQKQQRIEEYNQDPTLCKNCEKPLPYKNRDNKFCNRSCAASYNNLGVNRHGNGKYKKKKCLNCGKETKNLKCCSMGCYKEYHWKQREKEVEAKGHLNDWSIQSRKRYLLKTRPNECAICGIKEWNGKPILLIMDHIDGNSQNNNLDNLRLVCSNCDAQLDTYKSKNAGNGRHSRRERYAQGKSY
jgi:hypothetical protein